MSLRSSPNELLIDIAEYLDEIPDLCALSASCLRLHYVANPILYSLASNKRRYKHLLCWASENGQLGVVKKLLVAGFNPNIAAIFEPVERVKFDKLEVTGRYELGSADPFRLHVYRHDFESGGFDKKSPSWDPISGFETQCRFMTRNPFWFPLHAAASSGSVEIIKVLIKHGAYLNPPSRRLVSCEDSPRHNEKSGYRTVRRLLEADPPVPVDVQNEYYATPIMWALGTAHSIPMMKYLIQHGAKLDIHSTTRCNPQPTALLQACYNHWHMDAAFLIDHGANIHPVSPDWPSALDQCLTSTRGYIATTDYGAKPVTPPEEYDPCTNLEEDATLTRMVELIKKLVDKAHLEPVVDTLLAHGARIDEESDDGMSPLKAALYSTDVPWADDMYDTVDSLLRHGADPNKANKFGQTPLMYICSCTSRHMSELRQVDMLINYGADINLNPLNEDSFASQRREECPLSPLETAFYNAKYKLCQYLGDEGAVISNHGPGYIGMLEHLVRKQDSEMIYEFQLYCDDPHDYVEDWGDSWYGFNCLLDIDYSGYLTKDPKALWLATSLYYFPLAKILLDAGASDITWTSEDGQTYK
ncbi:ankyrin [Hypoxylon trugodes]|uniref:ankyrin n=1 Tax=Hypoxylon trugodes TaxID=326681 RepID=UPI002199A7F4|nr:ankyrin [Hypoxylon trugodes]KAI1392983.1 ankyrin [Hypoxylon trugodes]